jgi:hypothetical protein
MPKRCEFSIKKPGLGCLCLSAMRSQIDAQPFLSFL